MPFTRLDLWNLLEVYPNSPPGVRSERFGYEGKVVMNLELELVNERTKGNYYG